MSRYFKNNQTGFTLIEMLVSFSIITVIIAVIIFNQSSYIESAALSNSADEMSFDILQAQAYGIAVKELTPGSSNFPASYGIIMSLFNSGSNTVYLSFADLNGNKIYDNGWNCPIGGGSECLGQINISKGNYINALCAVFSSGPDQCNNLLRLDVSFARPDTDAQIILFDSSGAIFNPTNLNGARIELKSPSGKTRSVIVYKNGQVSVR